MKKSAKKSRSMETFQRKFSEYCQQTSLHGWQYVQSEKGIFRKLVWSIFLLVSFLLAVALCVRSIHLFLDSTTITTINSMKTPNDDIRFPNIYICNLNKVTKSFLKKQDITDKHTIMLFNQFYNGDHLKQADIKTLIDLAKIKYWNNYNLSIVSDQRAVLQDSRQSCENMLLKVKWSDKPLKFFMKSELGSTEYGECCVVVPHLDFIDPSLKNLSVEEQYQKVPNGYATNGIQAGFMAVLDLEAFDHATTSDSAGFKIGLSDPQDYIVMRQKGFNVQIGTLTEVAIVPTSIKTTDDVIIRFTPDERDCYTNDEFDLSYCPQKLGFRYAMQNCLYDRMVDTVAQKCNCTMTNHVRFFINASLPMCFSSNHKMGCYLEYTKIIGNKKNDMHRARNTKTGNLELCRPNCDTQEDNIIISTLTYPNPKTFQDHHDLCLTMQKIMRICADDDRRVIFEEHFQKEKICNDVANFEQKHNKTCEEYKQSSLVDSSKFDDNDLKMVEFFHNYAKENLAKIAIYLRDPYHISYIKDVKIQPTDFFGNIGGLLGLCLGFSIISFFELLFHCLFHS